MCSEKYLQHNLRPKHNTKYMQEFTDDDDDNDDELFLSHGWQMKSIYLYFWSEPFSEILSIANLWHTAKNTKSLSSGLVEWSCAEVITTTPLRPKIAG